MYASGYNKLFWGMMIIIFDINLGCINILPNFIGYMLIYSALNILSSQQEIYKKGKIPTVILIVLTLKDIWHDSNSDILTMRASTLGIISMTIGTFAMVINIYLMFIICKGIYELYMERRLDDSMSSTKASWNFYLVTSIIYLFYIPFTINISSDYNIIMILVGLAELIAGISIALVFKRCKVELEN